MSSTAAMRVAWAPPCTGPFITLPLHGEGRITVRAATVSAFKALNECLIRHNYLTRRGDTGGYVCRRITGGSGYSLHALGIAADLNWLSNPYGGKLITDMPPAMISDIEALRTNSGHVVFRWGGRYNGNKDAMHFEIFCTPEQLATGIRGSGLPTPAPPPNFPKIGAKQVWVIIRYPDGRCYRLNGVNRCPIPNPTMLGGDQIVLARLGAVSDVIPVSAEWGDTFPEIQDHRVYWNTKLTAQKLNVDNLA